MGNKVSPVMQDICHNENDEAMFSGLDYNSY